MISDLPSPFVVEWLPRVIARLGPHARALDVAMGRGRHAFLLARAGCRTFGVDAGLSIVQDTIRRARSENIVIRGWCADLERPSLPRSAFDLVLVTRFLQRSLFPVLVDTLRPGGIVMYETFTVGQRRHGTGPTSPDHLLEPGELPRYFAACEILFQEEVDAPEAVARLVARKPDRQAE